MRKSGKRGHLKRIFAKRIKFKDAMILFLFISKVCLNTLESWRNLKQIVTIKMNA